MESRGIGSLAAILAAAIVGFGLACGGYLIGDGFYRARAERSVTVRGLVERPVRADVAIWTISFTASGDDVSKAYSEIERDSKLVRQFATTRGFPESEIETVSTRVTDTSQWGGQVRPGARYQVKGGIKIRSADVDRVAQSGQLTGDLIRQGVVLNLEPEQGIANPAYVFTKLDSIRPAMLADATRSARAVAEQFARDSGSRLGVIRRANQGVFEITSRDAAESRGSFDEQSSIDKKVRLVSTIDYYLEN